MQRLPTKNEFEELIYKCKWKWNTFGYEVTGQNSNSIFLPAGYCFNSNLDYAGLYGLYWSSSLFERFPGIMYNLYFDSCIVNYGDSDGRIGLNVRTVSNTEGIDLGLSINWMPCNYGANKPEMFGEYLTYEEAINTDFNKPLVTIF